MRLMPKDKVGKIEFCRAHLAQWQENAAEIGVSEELIQQFTEIFAETDAAFKSQSELKQAAQAATQRLDDSIKRMQNAATAILTTIRGKAQTSRNKAVYTMAQIPSPKKGSPIAPPGVPERFTYKLNSAGELSIAWKSKNPRESQGTFYEIERKIDGGPRINIGFVGAKKLDDPEILAGTRTVVYFIRAIRSTARSDWGSFTVYLGSTEPIPTMILTNNLPMRVIPA